MVIKKFLKSLKGSIDFTHQSHGINQSSRIVTKPLLLNFRDIVGLYIVVDQKNVLKANFISDPRFFKVKKFLLKFLKNSSFISTLINRLKCDRNRKEIL